MFPGGYFDPGGPRWLFRPGGGQVRGAPDPTQTKQDKFKSKKKIFFSKILKNILFPGGYFDPGCPRWLFRPGGQGWVAPDPTKTKQDKFRSKKKNIFSKKLKNILCLPVVISTPGDPRWLFRPGGARAGCPRPDPNQTR